MNPIKIWFFARALREKALVTLCLAVAAVIWLSSALGNVQGNLRSVRADSAELEAQGLWLNRQADIEKAAAEAVKNLDPARTFGATRLVAEVQAMAGRAGLQVNTEPPRSQNAGQFSLHTVQLSARKVELPTVLAFYADLANKAPYLSLEGMTIQRDRSAPGALNINLQVASVELRQEK